MPPSTISVYSLSGAEALVRQAREWEASGEHQRAVECYLKVTPDMVPDSKIVEKCLVKVSVRFFYLFDYINLYCIA